jgi:hypothetical protein
MVGYGLRPLDSGAMLGTIISSSAGEISSKVILSIVRRLITALANKLDDRKEVVTMTKRMELALKAIGLDSDTLGKMFEGKVTSIAAASLAA